MNRRDFLRILGEQTRKRGERETRVKRAGRSAKNSRLSPDHSSSCCAPRHTLQRPANYMYIVLRKLWRETLSGAAKTTGEDLPVRKAMLSTIPSKTPTKTFDNRSTARNTCRFRSVPLVSETGKRSSSVPILSATQREGHKGDKISTWELMWRS